MLGSTFAQPRRAFRRCVALCAALIAKSFRTFFFGAEISRERVGVAAAFALQAKGDQAARHQVSKSRCFFDLAHCRRASEHPPLHDFAAGDASGGLPYQRGLGDARLVSEIEREVLTERLEAMARLRADLRVRLSLWREAPQLAGSTDSIIPNPINSVRH